MEPPTDETKRPVLAKSALPPAGPGNDEEVINELLPAETPRDDEEESLLMHAESDIGNNASCFLPTTHPLRVPVRVEAHRRAPNLHVAGIVVVMVAVATEKMSGDEGFACILPKFQVAPRF